MKEKFVCICPYPHRPITKKNVRFEGHNERMMTDLMGHKQYPIRTGTDFKESSSSARYTNHLIFLKGKVHQFLARIVRLEGINIMLNSNSRKDITETSSSATSARYSDIILRDRSLFHTSRVMNQEAQTHTDLEEYRHRQTHDMSTLINGTDTGGGYGKNNKQIYL